ncbi:DNA-3-methyladenine glycosylase [Geodermatophilus sp. DSM 44513]|uniref:DNA-3-methyladenine glycosylase family protein n=1 Tax=Geodermatophilus sp. DSM 44513 TaxID=1528104 RepID=UPI00127FB650|nr:DNA-3-methyladenine glycosylase [Geodermatophilus sp. DSM 44513]WNV76993.1 DNA-3-methyladenine glycosylase [Geodermatophilus sp. DSM 44513]
MLGHLAALRGDPTVRLAPGAFTRATLTPDGPGVLRATWDADHTGVAVRTTGDGAGWLLERAPRLLGLEDDPAGFAPASGPLRELWRRHPGARVGATGTVWHDLAWTVVQQRVTRQDAAAQWARLVTAFGDPAPGAPELRLPPAPETLARLSYVDLHRVGLERRRAEHLVGAARVAARLAALADASPDTALPALSSLRGVGPWTAGCLRAWTWGDPDTVIPGDDGIPSMVAWVLAGEARADDARMLALLEPHRPHRYRVLTLVVAGGQRPPRRAPRGGRHDIRRH